MPMTFKVDDVPPELGQLASVELREAVQAALGVELLHLSHDTTVVDEARNLNPLIQAVHLAFAGHRPLSLAPDHVWLAIAHGFAEHVDAHAEALRTRFVRHDGRAKISVGVEAVPRTGDVWGALIEAFGRGIEEHVGRGVHRVFVCSFSTTTPVERVASEVVMMSAFKRYFDFEFRGICGIPEVTLEGTPADWADIRRRVNVLAEYDLAPWAEALAPVLDQLVATAEGRVDRDFWQCIYMPRETYGDELITGWITRFFPYLHGILTREAAQPHDGADRRAQWIGPGVPSKAVRAGFSRAPLALATDARTTAMSVYGGLAGVRQLASGALRPEAAWAVGPSPGMATVVERILADHEVRPPVPMTTGHMARLMASGELRQLYARCDGGVLFDRWNLLPRAEMKVMVGSLEDGFLGRDFQRPPASWRYAPHESIPVVVFCTLLDDPRYFGLFNGERRVVVLCDPRRADGPEELVVVADDLATFFQRTMETRGDLWFEGLRAPTLYERLGVHDVYLRRALTVGPHAAPCDLSDREKHVVIRRLCSGVKKGTPEQRAFWWEALRSTTGTSRTYESCSSIRTGRPAARTRSRATLACREGAARVSRPPRTPASAIHTSASVDVTRASAIHTSA